jgi:4a-hydroxytetrahydrobiopterin dehydratase
MDSSGDERFAHLLRDLQDWQRRGDSIWRTYQLDDFRSAAQFVGRVADATGATGHQPDIAIRGGRVTLELAPKAGGRLTADDLAVAARIQRLVGDHHAPIGRAAPWSPSGPLTGIRERPVGPAGP